MDLSDIMTDLAVIKKVIYGNGVKGLAQKVEENTDRLVQMELIMYEKLKEHFEKFEAKLNKATISARSQKMQMATVFVASIAVMSQIVFSIFS